MKIACLIATRHAHLRAMAVIEVARSLSGGDVHYYVGVDKDDANSIKFFFDHPTRDVTLVVEERPNAIGTVWNRLASYAKDADVLIPMPDDLFPATPLWDISIAQNIGTDPQVIAWNDLGQPGQPTCPIINRAWYNLAGLYSDLYPFWFVDTHLNQLWSFYSGEGIPIAQNLILTSKKSPTKSMRELGFWLRLFSEQQSVRAELGTRYREITGLPPLDQSRIEILHLKWRIHALELSLQIPSIEKAFGDDSVPSPQYLAAKAQALRLLEAAA